MREIVVADPDAWCRSPGKWGAPGDRHPQPGVRCAYPGYRIKVQMGSSFRWNDGRLVIARKGHAPAFQDWFRPAKPIARTGRTW